jgi:hypothetical protein
MVFINWTQGIDLKHLIVHDTIKTKKIIKQSIHIRQTEETIGWNAFDKVSVVLLQRTVSWM